MFEIINTMNTQYDFFILFLFFVVCFIIYFIMEWNCWKKTEIKSIYLQYDSNISEQLLNTETEKILENGI